MPAAVREATIVSRRTGLVLLAMLEVGKLLLLISMLRNMS